MNNKKIAIIGMAARFPGAKNLELLKDNLLKEVTFFGKKPSIRNNFFKSDLENSRNAYLDNIDKFDYRFFGISKSEAEFMSPGQRLLLEVINETLNNAAYSKELLDNEKIAIFCSAGEDDYHKSLKKINNEMSVVGGVNPFVLSRISKFYNWKGLNTMVDTTCSSSMVCIDLAQSELLSGKANYAIVCGVNILPFNDNYLEDDMGIWSNNVASVPFSSKTDGMTKGEVVAAVLLKDYHRAIKDRDIIHAVLKSVSVNNNANNTQSPTEPDSDSQSEVIADCWKSAGINFSDIDFIEAHGSGTILGDSLEIEGLNKAFNVFNKNNKQKLSCPISSIKYNVGHGLSVSGLSGLIKATLCLRNKIIFPNSYYKKNDPFFNYKDSSVYVNRKTIKWKRIKEKKMLVGVTSLGISGVNAHALLEESCSIDNCINNKNNFYLIPVSGQSRNILKKNLFALLEWLNKNKDVNIADISYSLCVGRSHYNYRFSCVCKSVSGLILEIRKFLNIKKQQNISKEVVYAFKNNIGEYKNINNYLKKFDWNDLMKINNYKINKKIVLQLYFYKVLLKRGVRLPFVFDEDISENDKHGLLGEIFVKNLYLNRAKEKIFKIGFDFKRNKSLDYSFSYSKKDFFEKNILETSKLFYINNGNIDWVDFFKDVKARRVELPAYEFRKTKCWHPEVKGNKFKNDLKKENKNYFDIEDNRINLLKKIWADKFSVDYYVIKENDNFFNLGGNSLLAASVSKDIKRKLKINLDFEDIFDFPTISELFKYLDNEFFYVESNIIYTLREIWKEVLDIKKCNDYDNFFGLGGHSLLASMIIGKVKYIFLIDIDFTDIFNNPTPKKLSLCILNKKKKVFPKKENEENIKMIIPSRRKKVKLSSLQKRLYFLEKFEENSSSYNAFDILELSAGIDLQALEEAINFLVNRHELLRVKILEDKFEPFYVIKKFCKYPIEIIDVESSDLNETIKNIISDKFDFKDKLFKFKIIREKQSDTTSRKLLVAVFHYIILDDQSLDIFNSELFIAYNSFIKKIKPNLPTLCKSYGDFVVEEGLRGNLKKQKEYWEKKMGGDIPYLKISNNKKKNKTFAGRVKKVYLEKIYYQKIKKICKNENTTFYVFMATLFSLFLSKLSRESDVLFSTPVSLRDDLSYRNVFGFFVNTMILRTKINNNNSFLELLNETKKELLNSLANKNYSIDELIEGLRPERSINRPYFLNIMYQNDPPKKVKTFKSINNVLCYKKDIQFDLKLRTREKENNTMLLFFEYSAELFSSEQIDVFFDILNFILKQVMINPEVKIKDIDILSQKEEKGFNDKFNNTDKSYFNERFFADGGVLIDQFENQVKKNYKNIAIEQERAKITYGDLNKKANKLANFLKKEGKIGRKEVVGIFQERTIESIISILAVLKTGSAYLPIDLNYPTKRIDYMISQSKIKIVIGDKNKGNVPGKKKLAYLNINEDRIKKEINQQDVENLRVKINKNDLAYVIYTSGSTGSPKGVKIQNKAIINTLRWLQEEFNLTKEDVVAQKTALSFTDSVWEIFWPFINGSKLSIISDKIVINPGRFMEKLNKNKITYTQFVPALMTLFLENNKATQDEEGEMLLPHLKYIFNGGEALSPTLANRWYEVFPNVKIANIYGMTESAIYASNYIVPKKNNENQISVPLGKPIANTKIFILDKNNNLLPRNIPGQISISGSSLSSGYLYKKRITEEVFIKQKRINDVLYKTGDLGYIDCDYILHYLGRVDSQVQIRGYRIEIGEVESSIRAHKSVLYCAVILREEKRVNELCAFYVEKENKNLSENELRKHLRERLPSYMIPKYIYKVKEFPLNVHGKIDREKLKKIKKHKIVKKINKNKKNLKTKTEKKLAIIWEKILGFELIDRNANFFSFGGHSLSAIEMIYILEKDFEIKFGLSDVFDYPKLHEMAEKIDEILIRKNI